MKRSVALITALLLLLTFAASARGENEPSVFCYDFEFRISLNGDVFPARNRSHMQGYAELLDSLEFRGNIAWCPAYESMDLNLEIIPISNPDASVSFRLYGIPSDLGLSSPLLGDETIWFDNYVLMEFALKTWNNLHFPLQHLALLHPYVTVSAFSGLTSLWDEQVGAVTKSLSVSAESLESLSKAWKDQMRSDSRLNYWILALSSAASEQGDILSQEFENLPDYLLNQVSLGKNLNVTVSRGTETWTNAAGDTLFSRSEEGDTVSWTLSLPATSNGYVPFMSVSSSRSDTGLSLSATGSYQRTSDVSVPDEDLPDSLLNFSAQLDSFPTVVSDADFSGNLTVSGTLLPNLNLSVRGTLTEAGELSVVMDHPVVQGGESKSVLTLTGRITPATPVAVPQYSAVEMHRYLRIFGVNDQTMNEFVQKTARPLFFGILDFLYELPARGCQSVMDDVEDYGLLDMMLDQ